MAGVYIPLDRNNMPGRVTRRLRLECGERRRPGAIGPGRRRRLKADRAGPDHDPRCTVGWVGHATACQQATVTELFRNGSYSPIKGLSRTEKEAISGPKMMNTSDTTALSCGEPCIRSKIPGPSEPCPAARHAATGRSGAPAARPGPTRTEEPRLLDRQIPHMGLTCFLCKGGCTALLMEQLRIIVHACHESEFWGR
jgi:hypothetical protein